jgi:Mg2+ and Co2+ transporter CorA
MNMYIPENQWHYFYALFWAMSLGITGLMLARFRRWGWL